MECSDSFTVSVVFVSSWGKMLCLLVNFNNPGIQTSSLVLRVSIPDSWQSSSLPCFHPFKVLSLFLVCRGVSPQGRERPYKLHMEMGEVSPYRSGRPPIHPLSFNSPKQAEDTYIGMLLGTKLLQAATESAYPQSWACLPLRHADSLCAETLCHQRRYHLAGADMQSWPVPPT